MVTFRQIQSWLAHRLSQGVWKLLALLIVMAIAGPEIIISMELMATVEVLGASTFVVAYLSGWKLWFKQVIGKYKEFESYSCLFIPTRNELKQMPSLIIHAIPERTLSLCFLGMISLAAAFGYYDAI